MDSQEDSFSIIKGFLYNLKLFSDGFIGFQNILLDEKLNAMSKTFKLWGDGHTCENVPYKLIRILKKGLE